MERLMRRLNGSLSRSMRHSIQDLFQQSPLDLRFALQKTLDPRVTFTRASSGTYVGSDGLIKTATTDEARFDHNPTTGESLGLLVEEARTNLVTYSEDLSFWPGNGIKVLDPAIADPAGNTGTVYYPSISECIKNFNANGASQIAVSCFVKQRSGETNNSRMEFFQSVTGTIVNLGLVTLPLTGTFTPTGNFSNGTRTEYPNGWYRFTFIVNADAGRGTGTFTTAARIDIEGAASTNYVWGIQIEAGAFPTSYIPTTSTTVTRAADVASVTGANFSSWYNQTEGTVFAEFTPRTFAQACGLLSLDDGTTSERLQTRLSTAGNGSFVAADGGSVQANFSTTNSTVLNTKGKLATSFALNSFQACLNGESVASDTLGTLPTVTQAVIGNAVGAFIFNGPISRLTYWPVRLANPTLQSITTP